MRRLVPPAAPKLYKIPIVPAVKMRPRGPERAILKILNV